MSDFELKDNSYEFKVELGNKLAKALNSIGIKAENHAKDIITKEDRIDTGTLRNSISHTVQGNTAYIGTNVEYAVYHEIGTGVYLDKAYGKGRQTPWYFKDRHGNVYKTVGIKPIHFLKKAVQDNKDEYKRIAEQMKGE